MPVAPGDYETLSAMITPAIFLTANGSLIISTSNRMSRIVDRIRALNDQADRLGRGEAALDFPVERMAQLDDQLDRLAWRGDRIRFALTALYLAFAAFVGTSLTLALDALSGHHLAAVPTTLAVAGVLLMLGASVSLVREAMAALRGTRLEVRFSRELRARRLAGDRGGAGLGAGSMSKSI